MFTIPRPHNTVGKTVLYLYELSQIYQKFSRPIYAIHCLLFLIDPVVQTMAKAFHVTS